MAIDNKKLIEEYILSEVKNINSKYGNVIGSDKISLLVDRYSDSSYSYDEVVSLISNFSDTFTSAIDENIGLINEENMENITNDIFYKIVDKDNFSLNDFVDDLYDDMVGIKNYDDINTDDIELDNSLYSAGVKRNIKYDDYTGSFYGQSYNYQMIELFKIIDSIDTFDDGLDESEKSSMFWDKKMELLQSFGYVAPGIETLDYNTTKNLHNNFINDVDMVVDEGTTKMSFVVRGSDKLFLDDGKLNPDILHFDEASIVYDYAKDNGKDLKLHNILWHNAVPNILVSELDGKSNEEKKDITMRFLDGYMEAISKWSLENGYNFRQVDVLNEIASDNENDISPFRDSFWTEAVGIKKMAERDNINEEVLNHTKECADFYSEVMVMARKYFSRSELLYNEYNEYRNYKSDRICDVVNSIQESGRTKLNENTRLIDGLGMQSHYSDYYKTSSGDVKKVSEEDIINTTSKYADLGINLHRTEKDFCVYGVDYEYKDKLLETIERVDLEFNVKSCIAWNNNDSTSWRQKGDEIKDIHMVDQYGIGKDEYNRVIERYSNCRRKVELEKREENKIENISEKEEVKILVKKDDDLSNNGFTNIMTLVIVSLILFGIFVFVCI